MSTQNIKNVTVPLKVEELKDLIEKKDTFYVIEYKNSQLRDTIFLNYVSNLNLPCEILLAGCDFSEKENLLKAYFTTRNIVSIKSLSFNAAQVIYLNRGIKTNNIFENPMFTDEEAEQFIKNNKELVDRWEHFIESTIIFSMTTFEGLSEELDMKANFPVIDDPKFVGTNIVNMFSVPAFTESFFTVPVKHELSYFKPQFEDYMFKNRNLYSYYFTEENEIYKLLVAQVNGQSTFAELADAKKGAEQILSEKISK